ncbi:TRCF domain-containing protein [Paracoccus contaminans]|uniref:Transcription-repair-coupling factor n=1 Tax=Paracoccus contaminans TaxID=1945662 RepID=A0A1W6CW28_9RHOB|nr:TRCF domain-containing protein [Paracoccus contaminans]ARJ69093.1 DEAD/DEAH box helicase [Paracoccus contaminans]
MTTSPAAHAERPGEAEIATALAALLAEGDVIHVAPAEGAAIAVYRALQIACPAASCVLVPEADALPGSGIRATPANVGLRAAGLAGLAERGEAGPVALITTAEALAQGWPAPQAAPRMLDVQVGEQTPLESLRDTLVAMGYRDDDRVDEPGEVALHGRVLDVFPTQAANPVRIDAEDGRIAAIRRFDLLDQRTLNMIDMARIAPAEDSPREGPAVSLLDHLPGARLVMDDLADTRRRNMLALARDIGGTVAAGVLADEAWEAALAGHERVALPPAGKAPDRFVEGRRPLDAFAQAARAAFDAGEKVALVGGERDLRFIARRAGQALGCAATPAQDWAQIVAADPGTLWTLPMPAGRGFHRDGVLVVAAADLLGSRAQRGDAAVAGLNGLLDVAMIRIGDVVVHTEHGIGVVEGIEPLPSADGTDGGDAIRLTYHDGGVRLVPVLQADRIWRYGGEPESVTLDKLDGSSWLKRRGEVEAAVAQTAAALTELAAEQAQIEAPVLDPEPAAYERFAAGFPYAETPDQSRAIEAVRDDLASGRPMDRLVIGDVGFGKTEVALRAAALAVLAGKQVAVAVPTTVLARQHLDSFTRRFAPLGVAVGGLTRLDSAAEKKRVKAGLADGSIRIVIGTATVAGKGIAYDDLGLLVIDEEQRFGTADKRKMRALGAKHVLTMTATPIPRTLQQALVGLQQLSVIATPPARRQPIATRVAPYDTGALRTALLREKARQGQSFVVVPRIGDMEAIAATLARLVPELTVLRVHGEMQAAEIDDAMIGFANGDGDVLLATNIIEAGLDVPRANTMIVTRADRFGLAQLHQLRGRVGRGAQRGQMLMFTDPGAQIPERTLRRLQTLETLSHLGAGFEISARDLDLRGAGDLLGAEQAGHMKMIGIDLYQQLLSDAIRAQRGEPPAGRQPDLQLGSEGRLPEDWIADADTRLGVYMRLSRLNEADEIDLIVDELEDRFGPLPEPAERLMATVRIRLEARAAGVERVAAGPAGISIYPREGLVLDTQGLEPREGGVFVLPEAIDDPAARFARAGALMRGLAERAEA